MTSPPKSPKSFVDVLYKLQELSIRLQRIAIAQKIERAKAVLTALVPRE